MKIKSITKTNSYKHVEFRSIKDNWSSAHVLTPGGFEKVLAFDKIKSNARTILLTIDNGMTLKCDPHHRVCVNGEIEKFVKDLNDNDMLVGYNNKLHSFKVSDGGIDDLYDIQINDPHLYYTSGVLSHNSILLANNAIANAKLKQNVLYVTLELSEAKSGLRVLGALTDKPIASEQRFEHQDQMIKIARATKASGAGDIVIYQFPPDEVSVNNLYSLIEELHRTLSWRPDILVLDYMELMISRKASENDEYGRQKAVSTQLRGLAINENICVFTATQTNRSGNDDTKMIDVTKAAESYGKLMPMDYLISINQTEEEYKAVPAQARLFVAKNRNGPKFKSIPIKINYTTMLAKEISQ